VDLEEDGCCDKIGILAFGSLRALLIMLSLLLFVILLSFFGSFPPSTFVGTIILSIWKRKSPSLGRERKCFIYDEQTPGDEDIQLVWYGLNAMS
jgi:hypothetical protein